MNQEESEQNEVDGMKKGADYTGKAMSYYLIRPALLDVNCD